MTYDYGYVVGMEMEDSAVQSTAFSNLMWDFIYTH